MPSCIEASLAFLNAAGSVSGGFSIANPPCLEEERSGMAAPRLVVASARDYVRFPAMPLGKRPNLTSTRASP